MEVTAVKAQDGKLVAERPILQDSAIVDVGYEGEPGIIIGRLNAFEIAESGDGAAEVADVDVELRGPLDQGQDGRSAASSAAPT